MSVLAAGGHPLLTDSLRVSDIDNPRGYFEYEPVKALLRDNSWLHDHGGRAVKIICPLLPCVPAEIPLRVIFLQRELCEILASQAAMLRHSGRPPMANPALLESAFQKQLKATESFLANRPLTTVLTLHYHEIIAQPAHAIAQLLQFLPALQSQHAEAMRQAIDPSLYRQRQADLED
jgi:hypothetical protein